MQHLGGTPPLFFRLSGEDYDEIMLAATELQNELRNYEGVFDINKLCHERCGGNPAGDQTTGGGAGYHDVVTRQAGEAGIFTAKRRNVFNAVWMNLR